MAIAPWGSLPAPGYKPQASPWGSGGVKPKMPSFGPSPGVSPMGPSQGGGGYGFGGTVVPGKAVGTSFSGAGGGPRVDFSGPGLNNFAQKDPRVEGAANKLDKRYAQLQGMEGKQDPFLMESIQNLRQRMSADPTQRAIDRASSGAGDFAAGMKERALSAGARMGRGGDFGSSGIESAAQRLQAKQAADISLGRERDLDALTLGGQGIMGAPSSLNLARTGQTNQMLGQVAGFAPTGAQLGLSQQGLGLQQWQAGADTAYKNALLQQQGQQNQMQNYLQMLSAAGY